MALEDLLERLCSAIEGQNDRLDKMMAADGGKAAAKPAAGKATGKAAAKPAADKPKASGKKTVTEATIGARFGAYMKSGDEDDRDAAKANVRSLVEHYGAPKLTEIDPKHFPKLIEYLDKWEAGEEVEFDEVDDEGDGEDGDDGGSLL